MSAYGFNLITGGQADSLDAIATYVEGDIAYGAVNGQHLVYQMNVHSGATADGYYVVQPVGASVARWHLMAPGGAMSHVEAQCDTEQSVSNAIDTTLIFNVEDCDTLDEYDHTTGVFTAKYAGSYSIAASILTSTTVSWDSAKRITLSLMKNGVPVFQKYSKAQATFTGGLPAQVLSTVQLESEDTLEVSANMLINGDSLQLIANSVYNRLVIDRLA